MNLFKPDPPVRSRETSINRRKKISHLFVGLGWKEGRREAYREDSVIWEP